MKRSLIIGAGGQVGSQVAAVLGPENTLASYREPKPGAVSLDLSALGSEAGHDMDRLDSMFDEMNLDAIYCIGAMTDVEACESAPVLAHEINAIAPARLAAAAYRASLAFIAFSSDFVFDGRAGPYREDDHRMPLSAYGTSKRDAEDLILASHPEALIVRTTVVYGPDPREMNFVSQLRRSLTSGKLLRVADDQMTTPTFSTDLARATVELVRKGASGIVHVAGPEYMSRLEFARRAARCLGLPGEHIVGTATAQLGQRARRPLRGGLQTDLLTTLLPGFLMSSVEMALASY